MAPTRCCFNRTDTLRLRTREVIRRPMAVVFAAAVALLAGSAALLAGFVALTSRRMMPDGSVVPKKSGGSVGSTKGGGGGGGGELVPSRSCSVCRAAGGQDGVIGRLNVHSHKHDTRNMHTCTHTRKDTHTYIHTYIHTKGLCGCGKTEKASDGAACGVEASVCLVLEDADDVITGFGVAD
jgi:hypothetical protein